MSEIFRGMLPYAERTVPGSEVGTEICTCFLGFQIIVPSVASLRETPGGSACFREHL